MGKVYAANLSASQRELGGSEARDKGNRMPVSLSVKRRKDVTVLGEAKSLELSARPRFRFTQSVSLARPRTTPNSRAYISPMCQGTAGKLVCVKLVKLVACSRP